MPYGVMETRRPVEGGVFGSNPNEVMGIRTGMIIAHKVIQDYHYRLYLLEMAAKLYQLLGKYVMLRDLSSQSINHLELSFMLTLLIVWTALRKRKNGKEGKA